MKKAGPRPLTEEEREAKEVEKEACANSKRFSLVRRNTGTFGVYDDLYGNLLSVFVTRAEAIEELQRRQTGKTYYDN